MGVWPDRVPRKLDENSLDATVLEPKASHVIEHRRDSRRLMVLHPGAVGMTRFRETPVNYAAILGHTRHLIDEAPLLPE